MIQLARGGANPILPPPLLAHYAPSRPSPWFDCITIMIVDHLLSNFAKFFFGASRIIPTRVSYYCLFFNLKKVRKSIYVTSYGD